MSCCDMAKIRIIKPIFPIGWQQEFEKLFVEVECFSWGNMYDKQVRECWWVYPGRLGQSQPRGRGAFEDIVVPENISTNQIHITAIMRFIRQSERVLEGKSVTEAVVAEWCQLSQGNAKEKSGAEKKDFAKKLIEKSYRYLERFYNGEDIMRDNEVAKMVTNSTYYRSVIDHINY